VRDLRAIRASDDDRDEIVERLRDDYAAGRLTADELAERTAAAHAARTLGELDALTRDLARVAHVDDELERAIATEVASGWRTDWRGRGEAILSRPRHVSHVFHAVATLLTGGLWAIVWIAVAVNRKYDRVYVGRANDGVVHRRRLR
jgi:hypothetical protein